MDRYKKGIKRGSQPQKTNFKGVEGVSAKQAYDVMTQGSSKGLRPDEVRAVQSVLTVSTKKDLGRQFRL